MLKRANECIKDSSAVKEAEMVFDAFWRRGELALMFGEEGSGKSFLAIQIAEALAGGKGIGSFRLESDPGKTLYVDLSMTDEQFARRYAWKGYRGKEQPYDFSARLYRDRPPSEDELLPWLSKQIAAERIRYVIIDDLSAVMKTCDGTRETLRLMRGLRALRDRFGIPILVLMPSSAPGRDWIVSEADLGRQRALCRVADSVFAIGRHSTQREWRYLVQTRSRNAPVEWNKHNCMWATFGENLVRLKGLNFEDRTTEEEKQLIREVYAAKSSGMTFREIAAKMGISKSRASRLHQRWTALIAGWGSGGSEEGGRQNAEGSRQQPGESEPVHFAYDELLDTKAEDACGIRSELDDIIDGVVGGLHQPGREGGRYQDSDDEDCEEWATDALEGDARACAWELPSGQSPDIALADARASAAADPLTAMEAVRDHNGWIRYIDERFPDGKPKVWYQYAGSQLRKYTNDGWGVSGKPADAERFGIT